MPTALDVGLTSRLFEKFEASSDVFDRMKQFDSMPHIEFGAFNPGAREEVDELASLLFAVERGGERFRMVSLGAAPGDWALRAERAFRAMHPDGDFRTYCIEGDLDHCDMIDEFIVKNAGRRWKHDVRYSVIAEKDGFAYFPIINPTVDWGAGIASFAEEAGKLDANISISERDARGREAANGGQPLRFRTVAAVSLATLLGQTGLVDFLHSDIQGAERMVFPAEMDALDRSVRICCVSTHAKAAEPELRRCFAEHGWIEQAAHGCVSEGEGENETLYKDGIFVWSNPRLVAWPA